MVKWLIIAVVLLIIADCAIQLISDVSTFDYCYAVVVSISGWGFAFVKELCDPTEQ